MRPPSSEGGNHDGPTNTVWEDADFNEAALKRGRKQVFDTFVKAGQAVTSMRPPSSEGGNKGALRRSRRLRGHFNEAALKRGRKRGECGRRLTVPSDFNEAALKRGRKLFWNSREWWRTTTLQ